MMRLACCRTDHRNNSVSSLLAVRHSLHVFFYLAGFDLDSRLLYSFPYFMFRHTSFFFVSLDTKQVVSTSLLTVINRSKKEWCIISDQTHSAVVALRAMCLLVYVYVRSCSCSFPFFRWFSSPVSTRLDVKHIQKSPWSASCLMLPHVFYWA